VIALFLKAEIVMNRNYIENVRTVVQATEDPSENF
jgi:hypothetical protein